jgi:hypothetical protein
LRAPVCPANTASARRRTVSAAFVPDDRFPEPVQAHGGGLDPDLTRGVVGRQRLIGRHPETDAQSLFDIEPAHCTQMLPPTDRGA